MKHILIIVLSLLISSCASTYEERRENANDVKFMAQSMRVDELYSNAGYNTNYGLASVALVVLKPVIQNAVKDMLTTDYVSFHDVDWVKENFKDEGSFVDVNSSDLDLVKDELNDFFVKNGFAFNQYNKYRGMFHKKVGEKYHGIIVYVFPQSSNTIRLAIDMEIIEKLYKIHGYFSSEFAKNFLDEFKEEFEKDF